MRFRDLMLLHTSPVWWSGVADDPGRVLRFLEHLAGVESGGLVTFRVHPPDDCKEKREPRWLDRAGAMAWLRDTLGFAVRSGAEDYRPGDAESTVEVYRRLVNNRATLFFDLRHLLACYRERGITEGASAMDVFYRTAAELDPDRTYLGFTCDWSFIRAAGRLIWTPQLRVSNYWPRSRDLAPGPGDVESPPPLEAEEAAEVLDGAYWRGVETLFHRLRQDFGLAEVNLPHEPVLVAGKPTGFYAPVFYMATPEEAPKAPEEYLSSERSMELGMLARGTIGTHDLLSSDVTGAFLKGNLVTFRQEGQRDDQLVGEAPSQLRAYYLILPWLPTWIRSKVDWGDESEREAALAADRLAYLDLRAAFEVDVVAARLGPRKGEVKHREQLFAQAWKIAKQLQRMVAFHTEDRAKRTRVFEMSGQFRSSVSMLATEQMRGGGDGNNLHRHWEVAVERMTTYAHEELTARRLPGVQPLLELLGRKGPFALYGQDLSAQMAELDEKSKRNARSLKDIRSALQDMLEHERSEEVRREERHERLIGLALFALAVASAFPIFIGNIDLKELSEAIPGSWLRSLVVDEHRMLVALAVIYGIIVFVVTFGIAAFINLRRFLGKRQDSLKFGRYLAKASRLGERGRRILLGYRLRTKDAMPPPRGRPVRSRAERRALRRIDRLDRRATRLLIKIADLAEKRRSSRERPRRPWQHAGLRGLPGAAGDWVRRRLTDELHPLRHSISRFIISCDIMYNRPRHFCLPVTLCLFQQQWHKFRERDAEEPDQQFDQVLGLLAFEEAERAAIKACIVENSKSRAREFVEILRKLGVSALRPRPVDSPAPPAITEPPADS